MTPHEVDVAEVLDAMLDRVRAEHPGVEWSITVAEEQAARVPVDGNKLWRAVNGRMGYYAGHVYRDCLVDVLPMKPWFLFITPVDEHDVDALYGDLRTGVIATTPPADAYYHHDGTP